MAVLGARGVFSASGWNGARFVVSESYQVAQARRLSLLCKRICADHGVCTVVSGAIPTVTAVLVCNHMSYMDPVIVAAVAPALPVAKGEVARWPLIGQVGRRTGVMFVRRACPASGARVLRQARRVLREGASVLNFPEGTTTAGDTVLPFKRGMFGLAAIAEVPVVPVALRYESPDLAWVGNTYFLPHYIKTLSRRSWTAYVTFGDPMWVQPGETPAQLAQRGRDKIARMLRLEI